MTDKEDLERAKQIVKDILIYEADSNRLRPASRIDHIIAQICFKIDNPNYVKKI